LNFCNGYYNSEHQPGRQEGTKLIIGGDEKRLDGSTAIVANFNGDVLAGDFVFVCEHASRFIPEHLSNLGLGTSDLSAHIAWDIGAFELAKGLSARLGCGLLFAGFSRLVIDLNRSKGAKDLIPQISEATPVPGNCNLDPAERQNRIDTYYTGFHTQLEKLLDARAQAGHLTNLVSLHSFTPTYKGLNRPWQAGIIHDNKSEFALRLLTELRRETGLYIGENEPYSPADGVYHTLSAHGDKRSLSTAMIEIRNDCLGNAAGIDAWADRLAAAISNAGDKSEVHREAV